MKKKHYKIWALALVAGMVAAAIFLPELLLTWEDSQSLDILRMESQDEEREGFGESLQLSVPEKLLLLRGGNLTVMELDRLVLERAAGYEAGAVILYTEDEGDVSPVLASESGEDMERFNEEAERLWEDRLAAVRAEIRSLQALGGLPEVWKADSTPDCTGYGDLLCLDPDTHMSFQVYRLSLRWENCRLDLLVDAQSERILSFALQWSQDGQPNWGPRGASGFGSAWRDYWKMDSVSTGWYNEHTRSVLESVEAQAGGSGDYAAHDQITFMYDGQSLSIPLDCQGAWPRNFSISWNR